MYLFLLLKNFNLYILLKQKKNRYNIKALNLIKENKAKTNI